MTQEPRVDDGDPHPAAGGPAPAPTVTDDTAGAGAPGPDALARFFDRIRAFGAVRPTEGRWLTGACAAVSNRTGIDPLLVRGVAVVVGLLAGAGVFLYALAWLLLPSEDGRIHAEDLVRGRPTGPAIWATVILVISFGGATTDRGWGGWAPWVPGIVWVALIIAGLVYWASRQHQGGTGVGSGWPHTTSAAAQAGWSPAPATPQAPWQGHVGNPAPYAPTPTPVPPASAGWPAASSPAWAQAPAGTWTAPPQPRPRAVRPPDLHRPLHALTMATIGAALLACAVVVVWDASVDDVPGGAWVACLAISLIVVGAGVVAAGLLGRRAGGLAPVGILLALALIPSAIVASSDDVRLAGERTVRPSATSVDADGDTGTVDLGVGELVLDLTDAGLTARASTTRPVTVTARVGAGRLTVVVPSGVAVDVRSQVGVGSVREQSREDGGGRWDRELTSGTGLDRVDSFGNGPALVEVDAKVGLGELRIEAPEASTEVAR